MADVSVFSARMGLCTVVIADIRAASVRSVTRGGEAAAKPLEAKSCALIPERSWLSLGVRTVHQAMQEPFWALAWGRRGGTDVHVGWWPGCLTGLCGLFGHPPWSKLVPMFLHSGGCYWEYIFVRYLRFSPTKSVFWHQTTQKLRGCWGEMCLRPALGSHPLLLISSGRMAGAWSDGLSLGLKPPRSSDTGSVLARHPGACTASWLGAWWGRPEQAGLQCAAPCLWYHKELGSSRATHRVSVDRL